MLDDNTWTNIKLVFNRVVRHCFIVCVTKWNKLMVWLLLLPSIKFIKFIVGLNMHWFQSSSSVSSSSSMHSLSATIFLAFKLSWMALWLYLWCYGIVTEKNNIKFNFMKCSLLSLNCVYFLFLLLVCERMRTYANEWMNEWRYSRRL